MSAWLQISATLLIGAMLSGCLTSNGSLYDSVTPLQPFRSGAVLTHDHDGKPGHFILRREANSVYRFTISDRGEDFGEGYLVRFFPLKGAPSGTVAFEALELCKPGTVCSPVTSATTRLHGLARTTPHGIEVSSPDCPADSPLAKSPGATLDKFGTCTFSSRPALENALSAYAATDWKPDAVYSYY